MAQEVLHLRKKKGRMGSFILKVDLENVYDRVDWTFLGEVLAFMGFRPHLIQQILDCINSAKLAVSWKGKTLKSFNPSRGLRQGDLLLPYLFVLCMEVLSQRICKEVGAKE